MVAPVMCQYDALETQQKSRDYARGDDCLVMLIHEGPKGGVDAEIKECLEIAKDVRCDVAPTAMV